MRHLFSGITIPLISVFLTLLIFINNGCTSTNHDYLMYVGTYTGTGSDGIYAFRFNSVNGELTPIGLAVKTENPSYLVINSKGEFLYAVNEVGNFEGEESGAIRVFSINRESGALTLVQQLSSLGAAPCHLSFDKTGKYLMVANYMGGTAAVFPIGADGRLSSRTAFIRSTGSSVNPDRQTGPHAHAIQSTADNRFVLITDLGTDKLLTYRFDEESGALDPLESGDVILDPGSGPRHLAFSPTGKFVYVLNELTSTASVFAFDIDTGAMQPLQTISILPENFTGSSTGAEIVTVNGNYLYVSNRGHDSIGLFQINQDDGKLTSVEWVPSGGKTPRYFEIDPTGRWLLAANQTSNNLVMFQVDPSNGRLTKKGKTVDVVSPVCVRFLPIN